MYSKSYYIVAFCKRAAPAWWSRFIDKNFRHTLALKWNGKYWIMVHPRAAYTQIKTLPYSKESDLPKILANMEVISLLKVKLNHIDTYRWRVPVMIVPWSCVEQIKAVLGIRAWWVLTPRQLYKYLRRLNND